MRLLNSKSPTLIHSSYGTYSTVDLAFASPAIGPISEFSVLPDPMGNDHFPLSIEILDNILPSKFFDHKIILSETELSSLHHVLFSNPDPLRDCISSDLAADYDKFINLIRANINTISSHPIDSSPKTIRTRCNAALWWNETCDEAIKERKEALKTFRYNSTLDHLIKYKKAVAHTHKILHKQKTLGWRKYCTNFNSKTPTSELWKLIRSFKKRNIRGSTMDSSEFQKYCDLTIENLCPPSCLPPLNSH